MKLAVWVAMSLISEERNRMRMVTKIFRAIRKKWIMSRMKAVTLAAQFIVVKLSVLRMIVVGAAMYEALNSKVRIIIIAVEIVYSMKSCRNWIVIRRIIT